MDRLDLHQNMPLAPWWPASKSSWCRFAKAAAWRWNGKDMCKIIGFMYMFAKGSPLSAPYGNKIPKLIKHPLYGAGIYIYIFIYIYIWIYLCLCPTRAYMYPSYP